MGLLCIGTTVALVSFLAWFGTGQEHAGFLRMYIILVILLIVLQVSGLCWLYLDYTRDSTVVDQLVSGLWDFFLAHDDKFLMDVEQVFHCCGYESRQDRAVPRLLCQTGNSGCRTKWIQLGEQWPHGLVIGLVVFLMIQVCLLLMTVVTCVLVEKENMEEEAENQVQKQHVIRFGWLPTDGGGGSSNDYDPSGGTPRYYHGSNNSNNNNARINRRSQPPPPPHYGSLA
ncbi:unnamed protein product [Absidia cylindrospora]